MRISGLEVLGMVAILGTCKTKEPDLKSSSGTVQVEPVPATSRLVTIVTNTQATIDDVKIGAGNFRESDSVDDAGKKERVTTAGLWISVRGDPSQDRTIRAYGGLTFDAGSLRFSVRAVNAQDVELVAEPRR